MREGRGVGAHAGVGTVLRIWLVCTCVGAASAVGPVARLDPPWEVAGWVLWVWLCGRLSQLRTLVFSLTGNAISVFEF